MPLGIVLLFVGLLGALATSRAFASIDASAGASSGAGVFDDPVFSDGGFFDDGAAALSSWNSEMDALGKVFALPAAGEPYREAIASAENRHGIPPSLLARVLWQESRFRPDVIRGETVSSAGALGIAQFMPATARDMGVDPLDAPSAIDGAARYLRLLRDALGDWTSALAAYNWGIGNVRRYGLDAMPAETRKYVSDITADVGV